MSKDKVEELNKEMEDEGEHLGVANVRKRLKLYYGDQANMFFESRGRQVYESASLYSAGRNGVNYN